MAKFLRRKNEGDKMARGLIPQEIIDEIATRLDIVEVINEYVRLEKSGRNFFGLCPFHNEKTPSFSVSPEKQIFIVLVAAREAMFLLSLCKSRD